MKKCKTEAKQKMAPFMSVSVQVEKKKSPPAATISRAPVTPSPKKTVSIVTPPATATRRLFGDISSSDESESPLVTPDVSICEPQSSTPKRTVTTELVREFDKVDNGNQTETEEETRPGPLEEMRQAQNERIMINVGGRMFTTSRATLSRCRDSLLFKLINSARPYMRVEDNVPVYFIDRDPTHFPAMLHFLRDGAISVVAYLPKDPIVLKQVHQEAVFYGLDDLARIIAHRSFGYLFGGDLDNEM